MAQRQAWLVFEDEAGQTLRPPKARTWGRRGHTPVVPVSGKGSGRVSIAGLTCYRPGQRSRLIYRTITHRSRKNERRSFSERNYIALLDAAHQQLGGPIVCVWDNLNTHVSAAMRQMIDAREWLTVIRLPGPRPGPESDRGSVVPPQTQHRQPRRHRRRPPPRDHPQPTQEHPVPHRPTRRLPRSPD
ncbi:transposase [Micromonospora sp. NPDC092111]|uniref:transposase n=1 Tax=Micromonospora sp. NPDC092111 TaxID=3364289 RepID=UPI0037F896E1